MLVKFVEQPHVTAVARNFWFKNETITYFKVFIIPQKNNNNTLRNGSNVNKIEVLPSNIVFLKISLL